jgi:LmbE family N-acetylglucosaminyl deacetylase
LLRVNLLTDGLGPFRLLCLGAHSDDIEIGCGGTIVRILAELPNAVVRWIVFSGDERRAAEARDSAASVLENVSEKQIEVLGFRDGYFPSQRADIKDHFEVIKRDFDPSLILTHRQDDAHQDHRLLGELTFNTFRNHLVLEYEIPKYDGDLGNPNFFVPLTQKQLQRKIDTISHHFVSQRGRGWFVDETFIAMARLRGIGCNAPEGVAEAFYVKKIVF